MKTITPLPVIPGMTFRSAAGPEDGAGFAEIHTARQGIDGVDPTDSYEMSGVTHEFEEALEEAKKAGTLGLRPVVEKDGKIIAYGKIDHWPESDGTNVYLLLGWTHPDARNLGIGWNLLSWLEKESLALAGRDHPGEKAEFAANASSTETGAMRLLEEAGYKAQYTVVELRLDLDSFSKIHAHKPSFPEGFKPETPVRDDYREITDAVVDAFKKEYDEGRFDEMVNPEEYFEGLSDEERDPSAWRIVKKDGKVIAVVLSDVRKNTGIAEVVEVAVRPEWRKMGIAKALIAESLEGLLAKGIKDIRLCTVEQFQTRAIDLYQSLGFRRYKNFPRYRKPFSEAIKA